MTAVLDSGGRKKRYFSSFPLATTMGRAPISETVTSPRGGGPNKEAFPPNYTCRPSPCGLSSSTYHVGNSMKLCGKIRKFYFTKVGIWAQWSNG